MLISLKQVISHLDQRVLIIFPDRYIDQRVSLRNLCITEVS